MTHVMISYKREDQARVAKLVRALEKEKLPIWWDQNLPGGEEWRKNIETAVDEAACVIVVWSSHSVGPDGGFVRDEASRAKARGALVPVRIDKVAPPLGFGELQAIDLTAWKGDVRNSYFLDLVEACRAKLENRPAARAKGPATRLLRRAAAGSFAGTALAFVGTVSTNLFHVQDHVCTIPAAQPQISDFCGGLHMGGRPSYAERLAWEQRPPGSCAALRDIIARFPDGAYRGKAADLLAGAKTTRGDFSPDPRTSRGYVRQSQTPFPTAAAAQADARSRAQVDAVQTTCAPIDANERLAGADVTSATFDCRASPLGGQVCAADYVANCRIEARQLVEQCG